MRVADILEILDSISPFELQESWDNSGLQIGSLDRNVSKIVVSLDIEWKLLDALEQNSLLITHHPLIFKPLGSIDFAKYPSGFLERMIKKDISMISMHTNFDKTHLNDYVTSEILGFEKFEKEGFINIVEHKTTLEEMAARVKEAFKTDKPLRTVKGSRPVSKIAIVTGAGGSLIGSVDADLFLTGDVKYHEAMEAKSAGISVIDIEHYLSERYFARILARELKKKEIEAIIATTEDPFGFV